MTMNRFRTRGWKRPFALTAMALFLAAGASRSEMTALAEEIAADSDVVAIDDGTTDDFAAEEPAASSGQDVAATDLSGLFEDTGDEIVTQAGDTLEEARMEDETLTGAGDGGSTVNIGHLYEINGVTVRNSDFPSEYHECWAYANNVYAKIWGCNFWSDFNGSDNMLRNLPDEELTLTPEHLRAYVCAAPAGAALRVCNEDYLHGNDIGGHSQIIITHDANGFTVFEGGLTAFPHRREAYYTWDGYCYSGWPGRYQYIKYIKWPGAEPYSADMVGSSAQDLGESKLDKLQDQVEKTLRKFLILTGDVTLGNKPVKALRVYGDALVQIAEDQGYGEAETESETEPEETESETGPAETESETVMRTGLIEN